MRAMSLLDLQLFARGYSDARTGRKADMDRAPDRAETEAFEATRAAALARQNEGA